MNRPIKLYVVFIALLASACTNYARVERSERFLSSGIGDQKIIMINPDVRIFNYQGQLKHEESDKFATTLMEQLDYSIRKQGLNIEIASLEKGGSAAYYDDLLSLKDQFLQANDRQHSPLNFQRNVKFNKIERSVFLYAPLIAHEYGSLSKQFHTPYFSYLGFYVRNSKIMLYHLIVDTDNCETVYREIRYIPKSKLKKKYIGQMVYDAMAILKMELNEK